MVKGKKTILRINIDYSLAVFKPHTPKIKAPLHSLLGGFQPKPYHNAGEESPTETQTYFFALRICEYPDHDKRMIKVTPIRLMTAN